MRSVCMPSAARLAGAILLLLAAALPARAQYGRPAMSDPAVGENYHIEGVLNLWNPELNATIESESLGIIGDKLDIKTDLGYVDKQIREFRLVLRPARKHKFRVAYTPIDYSGDVILSRDIIFNGIKFTVGLPIQTEFKWNTWRLGYEYDERWQVVVQCSQAIGSPGAHVREAGQHEAGVLHVGGRAMHV